MSANSDISPPKSKPESPQLAIPGQLTYPENSVSSFGAVTLNYSWNVNGTALSNNARISGSQSNLLSIGSVTTNDAGGYTVVTNVFGAVMSIVATLTVALPPKLEPVALTNGSLTLAWSAAAGFTYQLQYSTSLAQATWVNVGAPAIATNSIMTALEPFAGDPQGFYRVLILR